MADDIIRDIIDRIRAGHPEIPEDALLRLESDIRAEYGGDAVYIKTVCRVTRNRMIWRDHRTGERIPLLARRYRISERQVRRIINEEREKYLIVMRRRR